MDTITPVLDQEAFRGRDDDVALNSGTWNGGGGLNGDWTQDVDVNFRCRFEIQETAGGDAKNQIYRVQFNLASGGWTDVSAATAIQTALTTQYIHLAATTQVIGDGSFVAGNGLDGAAQTGNITLLSQSSEIEVCLSIDSAQVTDAQTFQLRLWNVSTVAALDSYSNTPTITVNEAAGTAYVRNQDETEQIGEDADHLLAMPRGVATTEQIGEDADHLLAMPRGVATTEQIGEDADHLLAMPRGVATTEQIGESADHLLAMPREVASTEQIGEDADHLLAMPRGANEKMELGEAVYSYLVGLDVDLAESVDETVEITESALRVATFVRDDSSQVNIDEFAWPILELYREGKAGPWLLYADDTSAVFWLALDAPGTISIRVNGSTFSTDVDAATYNAGKVFVSGLSPSTRYTYEAFADGVGVSIHEFQTLPGEDDESALLCWLEFDHHQTWPPYPYMMAALPARDGIPSVSLIGGDFEVTGQTRNTPLYEDESANRIYWIDNNRVRDGVSSLDELAAGLAFRARVPMLNVWDDWDAFGNNASSESVPNRVPIRNKLWREFYHAPWVASNGIYFSKKIAGCLFVFLDERTNRTSCPGTGGGGAPTVEAFDPETAVFLGSDQRDWLYATLTANADAPFKFIITGGTWTDNHVQAIFAGASRRDSVGIYYRTERNLVMAWLRDNPAAAKGCILISGDDHHFVARDVHEWREGYRNGFDDESSAAVAVRHRIFEIKATPIAAGDLELDRPWDGSPWAIATDSGGDGSGLGRNVIPLLTIKWRDGKCHAELEVNDRATMRPLFTMQGVDGAWWVTRYSEDVGASYSGASAPATSWTPKAVP